MCFSATASFGASAFLAGAGIIAVKKNESRNMLPFACTPFFFGIHQLSEGFVWLALTHPEWLSWQQPAIYCYLIIAQLTWPLWVPFVIWAMEPDPARKRMISYFLWVGGVFALYMTYCFFTCNVSADVAEGHVRYRMDFIYPNFRRVMYFLATVIPLFLSSLRWMKLLAGTFLGSLILSFIFYTHFVISVWCFFAALLSAQVIWIIVKNKEPIPEPVR